ncbi:ATP-dependent zinc protease [Candidatus Dojkabacteria bacterium]|nr:ATP-dependent zinc protease [Candidatus Dojkabacteria bacterium]
MSQILKVITGQKINPVLGLNRRNQLYIRPNNPKRAKRIADSKLLCKRILSKEGLPVAKTYKVIYAKNQLSMINWDTLPKSFVIKPNEGTGGSGIIVFFGKKKGRTEWIRSNGSIMTVTQIKQHIEDIIDGRYSMGSKKDVAILEERIINHPTLKQFSYKGIPDIRVIIFNKVPVMSMVRLPTKASDGKGNVHAGAIAVGIDIATGITTHAIVNKKFSLLDYTQDEIDRMVDEPYLPLRGIQIPFWNKILTIAVKTQVASGLGYIGTDIALDKFKGPMVLELNARPGLAIQIANKAGLADRLRRIEGLKTTSIEQGISTAKALFGGEVEEALESISGKQIVAPIEDVTIFGADKIIKTKKKRKEILVQSKTTVKARIDTGEFVSQLDTNLLKKIGLDSVTSDFDQITGNSEAELKEKADKLMKKYTDNEFIHDYEITKKLTVKPIVSLRVTLEDFDQQIEFRLRDGNSLTYPVVLGRKDLKNVLIDPSRTISGT